jgi:uncharacterized protein YecE (DUF72 family)
MAGRVIVGTSGYNYRHWSDGVFYPAGVPQRRWLEHYAQFFTTVELNVTFYRLPKKTTFEGWYKRTSSDFTFAVKGSRFITHVKKLKDCEEPLKTFFDNASELKEKMGVVLWQLPPNLKANIQKLKSFSSLLAKSPFSKKTRHVFEFRHETWFCEEVYDLLKKHNFSLCIAHSDRWPCVEEITADFVYLRFHGGQILYGSNYSDEELLEWTNKGKSWLSQDKDIYAYFNNDAYGFAIKNALTFRNLLLSG